MSAHARSISSTVYTMHSAAIAAIFPRPRVRALCLHRGNASVTKRVLASPVPIRQRCGRIDALPRVQRRRGLLTHYAPILFLHAPCYVLTCCYGGWPNVEDVPKPCLGLGVIPADPWVILLARAACAGPHACSAGPAGWETREAGWVLGVTDGWGDAHLSTAVTTLRTYSMPAQ